MTFLDLINDVLIRMRETQVSSVNETPYSTMIGRLVNDAKRQVEDSYRWNVLGRTVTVTTVPNTFSYVLTGAGAKFQVLDALNTTTRAALANVSFVEMNRMQYLTDPVAGVPEFYCFDGEDSNGDTRVSLYPRPDGVYSLPFALVVPQPPLANGSDRVLVPSALVVQNAYARAVIERGEDGGFNSSEAFQLYRSMLADQIALEGTRYPEAQEFIAI